MRLPHTALLMGTLLAASVTGSASAQALASSTNASDSAPVQAAVDAGSAADTESTPGDAARTGEQSPSSTEAGHTQLDETFVGKSGEEWIRETRRKAFEDIHVDIQLRSYYLDRDKFDDSQSQAWAGGGLLGFKTGYFRERFAFGATGYTSQKISADAEKDGTQLLKPGQQGYTVLGEIYGEALLWDGARATVGRTGFDTPFINRNDARMTPATFQTALVQGLQGGSDGQPEWRYGFGYVDKIKERNSDDFVSMSIDAGAPNNVKRGVFAGGANFKQGAFSLGAIDYYSDDIINIFYTEAKYALPLTEDVRLQLATQYTDQRSTGRNLLTGSDFSADQWGVKAELARGGALFTAAYTRTGNGVDVRSPWGGYPGFTSVQVDDFNRAGENAWMLRGAYNFKTVPGLSTYGLWVKGSDPNGAEVYGEKEYDLNLQWDVPAGALKGLMLRMRYARIDQHAPGNPQLNDFRLMVFYDVPGF